MRFESTHPLTLARAKARSFGGDSARLKKRQQAQRVGRCGSSHLQHIYINLTLEKSQLPSIAVTSNWKLALVEPGDGKSMPRFHLNGSLHCIAASCEKFSSCGAVIYLHQPANMRQRADSKNLLYQYTKPEHSSPILSGSRMIRRILCKIYTLNRLLYLLLSDADSSAHSRHTLVLNSMLCNCQLPNKHLWLYLHLLSKGMTLLLSETKRNFIAHCSFPC